MTRTKNNQIKIKSNEPKNKNKTEIIRSRSRGQVRGQDRENGEGYRCCRALVDKSADKIVKTVKATGAVVNGPIPLPTDKKIFTVNRSTFVNKKSREQFELNSYRRLLDIYSSTPSTVDALMKLELPSGVEVEIKV